jgi:hypothetical protein
VQIVKYPHQPCWPSQGRRLRPRPRQAQHAIDDPQPRRHGQLASSRVVAPDPPLRLQGRRLFCRDGVLGDAFGLGHGGKGELDPAIPLRQRNTPGKVTTSTTSTTPSAQSKGALPWRASGKSGGPSPSISWSGCGAKIRQSGRPCQTSSPISSL